MKYKVLIVEDELMERALLEAVLMKDYPEVGEIYLAANGIEGLKLAEKKQPDIILADISMPGLSGLEMMEVLAGNGFPGKVIFTTAYGSFDYARRALEAGALGYILKPVSEKELRDSLSKAFSVLGEEQKTRRLTEGMESVCAYAEKYLVHDLLQGKAHAPALAGAYGFSPDKALSARLLVFHFWHLLAADEEQKVLALARKTLSGASLLMSFERNDLVVLLEEDKSLSAPFREVSCWAMLVTMLSLLGPDLQPEWASATPVVSSYAALKAGYDKLLSDNRKGKDGTLRFAPDLGPRFYARKDEEARVRKAVWGLKEGSPGRLTGSFHSCFSNDRNSPEGLYLALTALHEYDSSLDLADILLSLDASNLSASLDKWARAHLEGKERSGKAVIDEALEVMKREYASPDLTQTQLAERFGLNPAYFSRLFRKETGEKFISVMTDLRMTKAKELLDQGKSPEEAASLCGYSSRQYFSEAFRNRFGISIQAYQGKGK